MFRNVISIVAVLVILVAAAPAVAQTTPNKTPSTDQRWNVIYPVVGWMPLFGAEAKLPPDSPCSGCPPEIPEGSGSSTGLSGAWFGGARLEFGRFSVVANYNYAGLTAEQDIPFFRAQVKFTTASVLGGYRVYGPIFVEAGARYHGLNASFTVTTFPTVDWKPGQWSPAIGATYRTALRKDWRVYGHVDWSGLGATDVTMTNGEARVEWLPWDHFLVTGGYGFGHIKWDGQLGGHPIHTRQTIHGPIVGVGIPF